MMVVSLIVSLKSRSNNQANTYLLTGYYSAAAFYQSLQDVFPNQDFQDLTGGQEYGQSNEQAMQEAPMVNSIVQEFLCNPLPERTCGSTQVPQGHTATALSSSRDLATMQPAVGDAIPTSYFGDPFQTAETSSYMNHKRRSHKSDQTRTPRVQGGRLNNQSGTHKCERENPSTGKHCNLTFSRSYDLTRHEDTIHDRHKLKVKCRICTRTFARRDALMRHLRVIHPDTRFTE
jgi:hypothetical protein